MTDLDVHVTNVGGIRDLDLEIPKGVTCITGPNASNKTSLLKALTFVMGKETVPVRSGADEARVELTVDGRTVTRTATIQGTHLHVEGEGWISGEDADALVDFASLLEFNPLRTAVRQGDDVEAQLKRPVNLDALEAERSEKVQTKRSFKRKLDSLGDVDGMLTKTKNELHTKRDHLEKLDAKLAELETKREESTESDALRELREEQTELISERDQYERQVEDFQDAIERLELRQDELTDDLEEARIALEEKNIDELRRRKDELEAERDIVSERLDVLQSILAANREMLTGEFAGVLGQDSNLLDNRYRCWTCGKPAEENAFEETLSELSDVIDTDRARLREHEPEIKDIEERIEAAKEAEKCVRRLRTRLQEVKENLERRRESLGTKRNALSDVQSHLEALGATIAEYKQTEESEASDIATAIEDVRIERQSIISNIDRLETKLNELQQQAAEREEAEERMAKLSEEVRKLTDRIENTERQLRETFNETMNELVAVLDFDDIKRIWLDGEFSLVVAREVDGTIHREPVENLAESERESIGLVLALAGYLAYDLPEIAPVLALDSMGAFDIERLERLVGYFADEAQYLLVTAYPEISEQLDYSVTRVAAAEPNA
ncbi:archaea-specific SMC-related protein [Haladaptatus pallidirubidus]|uniref:DNA repair protein RecN n=1 Tax=Haladaptatus pallidirubidus TaxID=1008152 RepID=A0AAV3UGS6_9EURY|nr:archaea-specific SMC-related protein [Haladaptatus pallidirubidus]